MITPTRWSQVTTIIDWIHKNIISTLSIGLLSPPIHELHCSELTPTVSVLSIKLLGLWINISGDKYLISLPKSRIGRPHKKDVSRVHLSGLISLALLLQIKKPEQPISLPVFRRKISRYQYYLFPDAAEQASRTTPRTETWRLQAVSEWQATLRFVENLRLERSLGESLSG